MLNTLKKRIKMKPFNSLIPTTITTLCELTKKVNMHMVFSLLDTIELDDIRPDDELPIGSVTLLRWNGFSRGRDAHSSKIKRRKKASKATCFKNVITMSIMTKTKKVSVKLGPMKIHITGTKSRTHAEKTTDIIIDKLIELQTVMEENKIDENMKETYLTSIRGSEVLTKIENESDDVKNVVGTSIDHKLNFENAQTFDNELLNKITRLGKHFNLYSIFIEQFNFILQTTNVCDRDITHGKVHMVMVNYYFDLGSNAVNLSELHEKISEMQNGFTSRFNNVVDSSVTIQHQYTLHESERSVRRKDKKPQHTFRVYRKGSVMQSGPGEERSKRAYELFYETLVSIFGPSICNERSKIRN